MKQRRSRTRIRCVKLKLLPLSTVVSAAFFLLGALLAGILFPHDVEVMGSELRRYLDSYLALRTAGEISSAVVRQTFFCFFRASAVVFLLGFSSLGVMLIPLVCAAQGFLYAYALACFAAGLGRDGFLLLVALFAVRLLIVLPCTLLLSGDAWEASCALAALSLGKGKRIACGRACRFRFVKVCVCLFFGAVLELWLVPQLLPLLLR